MQLKLIVLITMLISTAYATQQPISMLSMRAMGMGGAQVAVADDETAIFVNPANLAYTQSLGLKLININAALNSNTIQTYSDIMNLIETQNTSNLSALGGQQMDVSLGLTPLISFLAPGFGWGVFEDIKIKMKLTGGAFPSAEYHVLSDSLVAVGKSIPFFSDEINLGVGLKYLYRAQTWDEATSTYEQEFTSDEVLALLDGTIPDISMALGGAVGVDLGMNINFRTPLGPTRLAVVYNNVGMTYNGNVTSTTGSSNTTLTEEIPVVGTVGFAALANLLAIPAIGPLLEEVTIAADYNFQSADTSMFKKLHIGAERWFGDMLCVRTGYNQGNWVGGVHAKLLFLNLDYVYWVEERGSEIGIDRIWAHVVQLGLAI